MEEILSNKTYKAASASVSFGEGSWVEIDLSPDEKIYKPKYMVSSIDWSNIAAVREKRLPYVRVVHSGKKNSCIEASPGGVRELPIFYAVNNGRLSVADNPQKLLQNGAEFSELSVSEFMAFGYVTSDRTLFDQVFSLEAGSVLTYKEGTVSVVREHVYNSRPISELSYQELMDQLWNVSEAVFNDLIKAIKGKTVILPLSAGYDSRFIASMLKLGGFEDVKCFAWGKPGNKDIETSRQVAKKLGYQWENVDYSAENWRKVLDSQWVRPLLVNASGYVSISGAASLPFQDYLENMDLANSVLLPGHTGDFIGGGHIPAVLSLNASAYDIRHFIVEKHFMVDMAHSNNQIYTELDRQVNSLAQATETYRVFEAWEQKERQAKFIANTNRYYERLGIRWSMPFWGNELVDFWDCVPLIYKKNLHLYNDFLTTNVFRKTGVDFSLKSAKTNIAKRYLSYLPWLKKVKILKSLKTAMFSPKTDEYGFFHSLPYLYNKTQADNPSGFQLMNEYCRKLGFQKPQIQHEYLARSVLAMIMEETTLASKKTKM